MTTFVCWKWQQKNFRTVYTAEHVNVWAAMLRRCYQKEHRAVCVTDDAAGITECETHPLWPDCGDVANPSGNHLPRCYRRLKIFSPLATSEMNIAEGETVVSMDLDVVLIADIAPIIEMHPEAEFAGWRGIGAHNPVVYNGSLFRFRNGTMLHLWSDFDPKTSPLEANRHRYYGSDQGWISYKLRGGAPGWGAKEGVFSYTSNFGVRGLRDQLPSLARIVSFNGKRKPWEPEVMRNSPWIERFWRR